jgi:phage terminase small subunit
MNPRRTRFVQEYLVDRNGAGAAVRAGYSPRTARQIAHRLLTKADVAHAVRKGEAQIAAAVQASRDDVMAGLLHAIDVARQKGDVMAQIAAWREIAKLCGYYCPERQRVEVAVDRWKLRAQFEVMTDAELLAVIEESGATG